MVLEIKYGKIMSANPQISGTTAFCLFPYTKNPSPIEPNSNPQRSHDSLNSASTQDSDWIESSRPRQLFLELGDFRFQRTDPLRQLRHTDAL